MFVKKDSPHTLCRLRLAWLLVIVRWWWLILTESNFYICAICLPTDHSHPSISLNITYKLQTISFSIELLTRCFRSMCKKAGCFWGRGARRINGEGQRCGAVCALGIIIERSGSLEINSFCYNLLGSRDITYRYACQLRYIGDDSSRMWTRTEREGPRVVSVVWCMMWSGSWAGRLITDIAVKSGGCQRIFNK